MNSNQDLQQSISFTSITFNCRKPEQFDQVQNNKMKINDQIYLELAVIEQDEDNKDEIIKKLKQEHKRKRRLQNKINKPTKYYNKRMNEEQLIAFQKNYIVLPYKQIISPFTDQYIFGDIVLEGDYYKDPFDIEKAYQWSFWKRGERVINIKDLNCLSVQMRNSEIPQQNFEHAIHRYINQPDQQQHQLGVFLSNYYKKIKHYFDTAKTQGNIFIQNKFKEQYEKLTSQYYLKCLDWLKTQVKNDDMYMYLYDEVDLDTLDQDFKYIGYSQNLLNLISLDSTNAVPYILRRGRLEFIDSISRLKRLICRLAPYSNLFKPNNFSLEHDIITIDDIRIPAKSTPLFPNFACFTPQNFEFYDFITRECQMEFCMFRLFKFEINPKIIQEVYKQRSLQNLENNIQQIDYEYSFQSETFIDKFYKDGDSRSINQDKVCGYRQVD